jgi:trypsin-like peptidase
MGTGMRSLSPDPSLAILALIALLSALPAAAQQGTPRNSIARIEAEGCPGNDPHRTGTGFAWPSDIEIVTALHVVGGCRKVFARSEHDRVRHPAEVSRVLARADLVLLKITDQASLPVLVALTEPPVPPTSLTAWGYPEAISTVRGSQMRVADGGSTLRENVPQHVGRKISDVGISLMTRVVAIQDVIAPGLSGAPLLDSRGQVRAIADGGVDHGITGVGWAISTVHLAELESSTEDTAPYIELNEHFSAAEGLRSSYFARDLTPPGPATPKVKCGTVELSRARTVKPWDVVGAVDAPKRVTETLESLQKFDVGINQTFPTMATNDRYVVDVWQDSFSGAAVAVPTGRELKNQGSYCTATGDGGTMVIQVITAAWADPAVLTNQFELLAKSQLRTSWGDPEVEPKFSRPDGMFLEYKRFSGTDIKSLRGSSTRPPGEATSAILNVTIATRQGTFLGVAAMQDRCEESVMRCSFGADWLAMTASAEIATFAISASRLRGSSHWQKQ